MKVRLLSQVLQEKAEAELNEVPNQLEEYVHMLRKWLSQQTHLKYRDDDQFLVSFLRASKFSLQRTKEKIDAFYTFRTLAPEIVKNMDVHKPVFKKYIKMGVCLPLPLSKEDSIEPRVVLFRNPNYDPDELVFSEMVKGALITSDILFETDDNYVISGVKMLWDMKGLQFKTAVQITPLLLKKIVICAEKAFPTRFKGFYVINAPSFIEKVIRMGILLLSKKLAKRVHFYSTNNLEAIYEFIPKSSLPAEYGGEAGRLDDILTEWMKIVEDQHERLLNEDNYYSDESKRPFNTNYLTNDILSVSGIEGFFRKLEID